MAWEIRYYSAALQRGIMEMPPGIQGRYIHLSARMSIYGPDLRMPHTRALGGGLFELRMKSHEGIGRVFYCTMSLKKDRHAAQLCEEDAKDADARNCYCASTHEGGKEQ